MSATFLDTLSWAKKLEAAGVTQGLAETTAQVIADIVSHIMTFCIGYKSASLRS